MSLGEKKSIYHSTLAKAGDVRLSIKSDVLTSKYKKEGEAGHFYVIVEHDGGPEQTLLIENEACRRAMMGFKGEDITIKASGAREDATISIVNSDGTTKSREPILRHVKTIENGVETHAGPDMNAKMIQYLNACHLVEQKVWEQVQAAVALGIPSNDENFGGKCGAVLKHINGMVNSLPTTPVW